MIRKVIVVGTDRAILADFLRRTNATIGFPGMFYVTGITLGVVRRDLNDMLISLFLWTIPRSLVRSGLATAFSKGHSSAIIVITPEEIPELNRMVKEFNIKETVTKVVVVRGTLSEAERAAEHTRNSVEGDVQADEVENVGDIFDKYTKALANPGNRSDSNSWIFLALPPNELEEYYPPMNTRFKPLNAEEIIFVKNTAKKMNLTVNDDSIIIPTVFGRITIRIATGDVIIHPIVCDFCVNRCKKTNKICIVRIDDGWSSEEVSSSALLVIAKAYALQNDDLPEHVINQLLTSNKCDKAVIDPEGLDQELYQVLWQLARPQAKRKRSLIDEARDRRDHGRLSERAFNVLRGVMEKYASR